jgi:hypothetical protein
MRRTFFALVVGVVMLTIASGASAGKPAPPTTVQAVPCTDPRGCPNLRVDGGGAGLGQHVVVEETYAATDCAVVEGSTETGTRRLLRFTYTTPNLGPGDLIVGAPADHPEWFEFHPCHGHHHFKEYADYRLWTPAGYAAWQALRAANPGALPGDLLARNPAVAEQMVVGEKQGFCDSDVIPATSSPDYEGPPPGPNNYSSCRSNQGISVGWADSYFFVALDGQWMDVTDVAPGDYVLEAEVNPERFFVETNYRDNASAVPVVVPRHPGKKG